MGQQPREHPAVRDDGDGDGVRRGLTMEPRTRLSSGHGADQAAPGKVLITGVSSLQFAYWYSVATPNYVRTPLDPATDDLTTATEVAITLTAWRGGNGPNSPQPGTVTKSVTVLVTMR